MRRVSDRWCYGYLIVSSRELDASGAVGILSVWKDGGKVVDHGDRGEWRRVYDSPFCNGRPPA